MATITKQTIYLDLTPGRVFPVLHVSQGDTGLEALEFKLVQNGMVFNVPAAVTDIQLNGTTPLGVFSYNHASGINWSGNTVTAAVTQTMTAEKGMVVAELVLLDSAMHSIGSLNFLLSVEPSPYTVAHVSTSDMASIVASLNAAQQNFLMSKSWAVGDTGLRDGEATNNSKYWSEQSSINGERWSVGKINGEDVPSTDETYENNSKYWAGVAEDQKVLAAQYGSGLKAQVDTNTARITEEVNNRVAAVTSEASTRSTAVSSLQSQIDQYVTPSTQQPDEVVNARVGVDGTTYSTLGDAVRGQVTDLKSHLDVTTASVIDYGIVPTFAYGYTILSSNGNYSQTGTRRCSNRDFIKVRKGDRIYLEGLSFTLAFYDNDNAGSFSAFKQQGTAIYTAPKNGYVRMTIFNDGLTADNVQSYSSKVHIIHSLDQDVEHQAEILEKLNTINILDLHALYNTISVNGITYAYDSDTESYDVNGTASALSVYVFFDMQNSLPRGIEAGRPIYVEYEPSANGVTLQFVFYMSGSTQQSDAEYWSTSVSSAVYVPYNCTGLCVRFRVGKNTTLDHVTVPKPIIYSAINSRLLSSIVPYENGFAYATLKRKWIAQSDIPYLVNGVGGTVVSGTEMTGLPYSDVRYNYNDLFFNRSWYSFLTASLNPAADIYRFRGGAVGASGKACYWGGICSSWICWFLGLDMLYVEDELENLIEFFDYNDLGDLQVGDIIIKGINTISGHVMCISRLFFDTAGQVDSVELTDMAEPGLRIRKVDKTFIDSLYKYKGGQYLFCRLPKVNVRSVNKQKDFNRHVLSNRGDSAWFISGESIYLYVDDVNTYPNLYYKKINESNYASIAFASLPTETINGHTVYNASQIFSDNADYLYATDTIGAMNELAVVDLGDITISGGTFSVSGYSANVYPSWYQFFYANEEAQASSPDDDIIKYTNKAKYTDTEWYGGWQCDNSQTKFNLRYDGLAFNPPQVESAIGAWVRIYYKTNYGYAVQDSNIIKY